MSLVFKGRAFELHPSLSLCGAAFPDIPVRSSLEPPRIVCPAQNNDFRPPVCERESVPKGQGLDPAKGSSMPKASIDLQPKRLAQELTPLWHFTVGVLSYAAVWSTLLPMVRQLASRTVFQNISP